MQVRVPEGMSMEQLDVIKLTAQFVARNGKQFLAGEPQPYYLICVAMQGGLRKSTKSRTRLASLEVFPNFAADHTFLVFLDLQRVKCRALPGQHDHVTTP